MAFFQARLDLTGSATFPIYVNIKKNLIRMRAFLLGKNISATFTVAGTRLVMILLAADAAQEA